MGNGNYGTPLARLLGREIPEPAEENGRVEISVIQFNPLDCTARDILPAASAGSSPQQMLFADDR
jgi:hypothetical protein